MDQQGAQSGGDASGGNQALRNRFERLRALRSAWGVLAPSGLYAEKNDVADTGRALADELKELGRQDVPGGVDAAFIGVDSKLDAFDSEMRDVALSIPIGQLRSTLPERVSLDRRGVLDLLDLVLRAEVHGLSGTESRIGVIDYLITLLCTEDAHRQGTVLHDPVTLTPTLFALCERSDAVADSQLSEIEAEFFAAANMTDADTREEVTLRSLRRRKAELGPSYFASRILRAIVTYNVALLHRIDEEIWDSQDWGRLPSEPSQLSEEGCSVFEASVLGDAAAALRRRISGEAPESTALDRIVWCLDLGFLDPSERVALRADTVGTREDLKGTTILVGLLSRSAVVLEEEFPGVGISPELLSGAWTAELEGLIQQEANRLLASDYRLACSLTELKSKFLNQAMAEVHREYRLVAPPRPTEAGDVATPRQQERAFREEAKKIALDALEGEDKRAAQQGIDWSNLPWPRIARWAGGAVAASALLFVVYTNFDGGTMNRYSSEQLAALSPYLGAGSRNAEGIGPAFVGELSDSWSAVPAEDQILFADDLVARLRAQGVSQIMIYDDAQQLRIQALGGRPATLLSGR